MNGLKRLILNAWSAWRSGSRQLGKLVGAEPRSASHGEKPRTDSSFFSAGFDGPAKPIDDGRARGFGPGYTIGAVTGLGLFAAAFLYLFLSLGDDVRMARGIGFVLMTAGGSFLFAIGYQLYFGINVPWTVARFGRIVAQGEFDRGARPVTFWLAMGPAILLFLAMFGVGVWLIARAGWVAAKFS